MIEYQIISSPVGEIIVAEKVIEKNSRRIFCVEFINNRPLDAIIERLKYFYRNDKEIQKIVLLDSNSTLNSYRELKMLSFNALFDTNTIGRERLDLPKGTEFQKKVWETIFKIPFGTIVSYSQLAQMAGYPNAVRAVASAVGDNPISLIIPCHRVVRKEALLRNKRGKVNYGEYMWGEAVKRSLIEWEMGLNGSRELFNLKEKLFELSTSKYRKFSQALILTNKNHLLGVRLPALRELAKEILRGNWQEFLANYPNNGGYPLYLEELMVWGMVINGAKIDIVTRLKYVHDFVSQIDNWAVCDTFCTGAKWAKKEIDISWSSLQHYLESDDTYQIRYAVVMLISYFLLPNKISAVLEIFENLSERVKVYREYYIDMAIAWAISASAAKYSEQTLMFLEKTTLPLSLLKKAAQKIRDSYRVNDEYKQMITNLINSRD